MSAEIEPLNKNTALYGRFLLCVAGLGGLLYGIDVGVISAALLYLGRTISLSEAQTSAIVAAVLGGSTISSLLAGFMADFLGRKKMMIVSGVLFVASVALIVASHNFVPLFLGRLLQGLSGGVIAVVVPLYLAECLSPKTRGRGSTVFQLMLTFGIMTAAILGLYYIHGAEAIIAHANGNQQVILDAENHAWRGMFLAVIYPGFAFLIGSFFLSESPRWLFRKGWREEAYRVLLRTLREDEARLELKQMEEKAEETKKVEEKGTFRSLLKKRYVIPFVLACVILACNQATGINSVLAYLSVILQQAGMSAQHAAQGDLVVKVLNFLMTIFAIGLVDKKGRRFLLTIGTAGVVLSMLFETAVFYRVESKRTDVQTQVQSLVSHGTTVIGPAQVRGLSPQGDDRLVLRVLYSQGDGERIANVFGNGSESIDLHTTNAPVEIHRAFLFSIPPESSGWLATLGLALFIAFYASGPGVVVWLALSELMPTRIRSAGMGIALLLNQGVSTLIAGVFLPVVSRHGYYAMFAFWAACTTIYFLTAFFFLPETKGKTLEEIEGFFA